MLLAIENAPPGRRAWYGMFPQLGAPVGFVCSACIFLLLSAQLTDEQFFSYGWRIPFLASAALVVVGLYVRLAIHETPVFREALSRRERVKLPMGSSSATIRGARARDDDGAGDVRAVLPDDGLRAVVGDDGARLHAAAVPAHPVVRHRLLCADDPAVGGPRRSLRPAADAAVDDGGDRRVRLRARAGPHGRHDRRDVHDGAGPDADGVHLRSARARRCRSCFRRRCATPAAR